MSTGVVSFRRMPTDGGLFSTRYDLLVDGVFYASIWRSAGPGRKWSSAYAEDGHHRTRTALVTQILSLEGTRIRSETRRRRLARQQAEDSTGRTP